MRTHTAKTFPLPWVTELGVAAFFGIVVTLLFARSDYDPLRRYISEYAIGAGGWALRMAFAFLGLASLNLVPGLLRVWNRTAGTAAAESDTRGRRAGRRVGWAVAVWGTAVLAGGAFPVDIQGAAITATGAMHLAAAGVGFLALFVAMGNAVQAFRAHPGWRDLAGPSRWVAVATPTAFVLEATILSTLGWVGLGQWLLFGLAGGWLVAVAVRFRRRAGVACASGKGANGPNDGS